MFDILAETPEEIFTNTGYWVGLLLSFALFFVEFFLLQGIATGALARAVGDNYLGRKTGILAAYREVGKLWLSLFGALFLLTLLVIAAALWWVIVPCIGWFTGLGLIIFLAGVIGPITAPVVILEGQSAIDAVRRAWNLARRRFWPVIGYTFVLYLFSLIVIRGPSAVVSSLLMAILPSSNDPSTFFLLSTIIQSLVSLVATLLYFPLQMAAFTLVYFDLRVRTEGFDIALLTMQYDASTSNHLMPAPPPSSGERLFTPIDIGNFAILTLGPLGVYILFVTILYSGVFFLASLFG
jgi:hypothetical protein